MDFRCVQIGPEFLRCIVTCFHVSSGALSALRAPSRIYVDSCSPHLTASRSWQLIAMQFIFSFEREQERDEWVACIGDDDSQTDGHKRFARETEQLRLALQLLSQNRFTNRVSTAGLVAMMTPKARALHMAAKAVENCASCD